MTVTNDLTRANLRALATEAPGAILGHRTSEEPTDPFFRRARYDAPEDPGEAARATFLAAANDAPGAVLGVLSACRCRRSLRPGFILWDRECPRHGARIPRDRARDGARLRARD